MRRELDWVKPSLTMLSLPRKPIEPETLLYR